jgi:hypothetical protein
MTRGTRKGQKETRIIEVEWTKKRAAQDQTDGSWLKQVPTKAQKVHKLGVVFFIFLIFVLFCF